MFLDMDATRETIPNQSKAASFRFGDGDAPLRSFLDNAMIPTFLVDTGGLMVYANPAASDMLGYSPRECAGLDFKTLVHPDDLSIARAQIESLIAGKTHGFQAERRYFRKNGETIWALVSVSMLSGGSPDFPAYLAVQAVDIDRQKRAEAALTESERRWNFALESARQGVWEADVVTNTVYYSRMWKLIRGFDPDELVDSSDTEWLKRVHPDDRERILDIIRRQNSGEIKRNAFEYRERHKAGHYIWIESKGAPDAWGPDGKPTRVIGTDTDITERKLAEQEKLELSRRLELALDVSQIGVYEENRATGELIWDNRLREIYGVPPEQKVLRGSDWENRLHPEDAPAAVEAIARAVKEKGSVNIKYRILRPDGQIRTIMSRGIYVEDVHASPKFIGADWDITSEVALTESLKAAKVLAEARNIELEAAKARIETQALHDALTGLPNRRYLDKILNQHSRRHREAGDGLALLHIDLDRFKQINDTLGHAAGDAMLVHVARLLNSKVGGQHFVARIGGDEFVIACFNQTDTKRLAALADQIIAKIRQPVPYQGHFCRFGASVGIAIETGEDIDAPRVLVNADIALYRAKGRGRNRHEFFSKALQSEIESTKHMADEILSGLEQGEFRPYYQPLLDANTHDVVGVEALVRWHHPREGILTPNHFLKVAEDLNVLSAIDRTILQQAILDLDHWQSRGIAVPSVSVNVSFRRLSDDRLIPSLRELKIKPGTISFEFLESIFLDEFDDGVAWNIDAIREMGIGIDLDDFGTGHTSIVSLLKLKPRRFKIDRQLINPIVQLPAQRRLVASIIDIGKSLGIKVVAEGVETMEQARILKELGCDILQGYAFARPMPADQLASWIGEEKWRKAS
jgi:diguanylate cyclase (GGDEF)-like protein/PAS domain S-box-containing protein